MFTLLLLVVSTVILCGCEISDIHKDYMRTLKHVDEDKPANDCSIADYEFFNEHVNDCLRNN